VSDLAHRFEHRLFLTATPHNGHSNSFSALLEMLDPVAGEGPPRLQPEPDGWGPDPLHRDGAEQGVHAAADQAR
jgi:hypothetical protein